MELITILNRCHRFRGGDPILKRGAAEKLFVTSSRGGSVTRTAHHRTMLSKKGRSQNAVVVHYAQRPVRIRSGESGAQSRRPQTAYWQCRQRLGRGRNRASITCTNRTGERRCAFPAAGDVGT
jgi:hypothetical protein